MAWRSTWVGEEHPRAFSARGWAASSRRRQQQRLRRHAAAARTSRSSASSAAPSSRCCGCWPSKREGVRVAEMLAALGPRVGRGAVLEAVEGPAPTSLIERAETHGAAGVPPCNRGAGVRDDRLVEGSCQ